MFDDEKIENLFRWLKFKHYEKDEKVIYTLSVNAEVDGLTYNFNVDNIDSIRFFDLIYDYVMGFMQEEDLFNRLQKIERKTTLFTM